MHKTILTILLAATSVGAAAEWIRVGENDRSVAYADSKIQKSGDYSTLWVMFDYKSVQNSPRSGRQYLSEKAQREIDCKFEKGRVLFFTWHADQMGNGVVVYTGRTPTDWEPTSAPGSYASEFSKFACRKRSGM